MAHTEKKTSHKKVSCYSIAVQIPLAQLVAVDMFSSAIPATAFTAAALVAAMARAATRLASARVRPVCHPEAGQRHASQTDTEFLQGLPPRC